jgi:adenosine deaminase
MPNARAVTSLVVAAGIFGLGWYLKRQRKSPIQSSAPSKSPSFRAAVDMSEDCTGNDLRAYIANKPKVELHCHLNGSVRRSTLNALLEGEAQDGDGVVHTIEDAFREFKRVYRAINSERALRRIVRETLEDVLEDNIRYLELRTTPRKLQDVTSRREYVKIVIDEINSFPNLNRQKPLRSFPVDTIAVRLILTVDRSQPLAMGDQTIDIALRFPGMVVGIDFAGNPTVGRFSDFETVFQRAKGHGLYTTIHTSEIRDVEDETDAILEFRPNRIGHFLFPTQEQAQLVKDRGIFIESCPTSNICAISGKSPVHDDITGHSTLERFIRDPSDILSINTDDPGVFDKRLSEELFAVAKTFKLTKLDVHKLVMNSAKHAFLSTPEREALSKAINDS